MFADVHKRFLDDARQFMAGVCRQRRGFNVANESSIDSRLITELRYEVIQKRNELAKHHSRRLHPLHQISSLLALLAKQLLNSFELKPARRGMSLIEE